jgi:Zn-dependent protease with chaperone function
MVLRILGPLMSLAAIALFVLAMLAAVALTLVVPAIALGLGLVSLALLQPWAAVQALEAVPPGLVQAGRTLWWTGRALIHPLRPSRPVRVEPHAVPDLHRLIADVAGRAALPTIDDVVLTPQVNFGVVRWSTPRGPRVVLFAGTPLLYVLSIDELRAVIAHELAHVALGHLGWSRALGRWGELFEALEAHAGASWHPVDVTLTVAAAMFRTVSLPWSRQNELDADARAVRAVGASAQIAALRRVADVSAGMSALMSHVAETTARTGVGPESWTEASWRALESLAPPDRARLRRAGIDDPFDIDGCTHPPIALRIAALGGRAEREALDDRPAITFLPDVRAIERQLTQASLRARRWVPARAWAAETAPAHVERRQRDEVLGLFGDDALDLDRPG